MQKRVYPCEYLVDLEKLNEISLHEKEDFDRHICFEGIANVNYMDAKKVCKDFEILENLMICMFKATYYC